MKITVWSDFACPYCYIGEKRLHQAIRELGIEDRVTIEPKAFELDPGAPKTVVSDTLTRFASKYRLPLAEARAQIEHISRLGQDEGIDFRYATAQYTNTFDAHRLMKLAETKADAKIAEKLIWLLFDAYFSKNLQLANPETLLACGLEAGLDDAEIKAMLQSDQFAAEVHADELAAAQRGVHGVPYFVFENGLVIPGAVSESDMRQALLGAATAAGVSVAAKQCGPDGCLI